MTEEDLAAQMEADRLLQATLRAQVVKSVLCIFLSRDRRLLTSFRRGGALNPPLQAPEKETWR